MARTKAAKQIAPPEEIDNPSADRLYQMVVRAIRAEILTGVYLIGQLLPSEAALVARFGVSRHTVREALRHLRDLGVVESRQGYGTVVANPGGPQQYVHHVNSISDLHDFGVESQYAAETSKLLKADDALAKRLNGSAGQSWLRIEGLRFAAGQEKPICAVEIFVASQYAGVGRLLGRRAGPVYSLIETIYGESIGEVEQSVRALKLKDGENPELGLPAGETVVEIRRVYRLLSGDVAEVTFNRYPADRFSMSMVLRRVRH